jgi:hypothetical protein
MLAHAHEGAWTRRAVGGGAGSVYTRATRATAPARARARDVQYRHWGAPDWTAMARGPSPAPRTLARHEDRLPGMPVTAHGTTPSAGAPDFTTVRSWPWRAGVRPGQDSRAHPFAEENTRREGQNTEARDASPSCRASSYTAARSRP